MKAKKALKGFQDRHPFIGQVRGSEPMLAMELVEDPVSKKPAPELVKRLTAYCHEHGLLILNCGTLGNNVCTRMPLVISDEQLQRGLDILTNALEQL